MRRIPQLVLDEALVGETCDSFEDECFYNYSSYRDNCDKGDAELDREVAAGSAVYYDTKRGAEEVHGWLLPSRLAVLVKHKADGSEK
eukprot:3855103-Amphidinium_carterae.1